MGSAPPPSQLPRPVLEAALLTLHSPPLQVASRVEGALRMNDVRPIPPLPYALAVPCRPRAHPVVSPPSPPCAADQEHGGRGQGHGQGAGVHGHGEGAPRSLPTHSPHAQREAWSPSTANPLFPSLFLSLSPSVLCGQISNVLDKFESQFDTMDVRCGHTHIHRPLSPITPIILCTGHPSHSLCTSGRATWSPQWPPPPPPPRRRARWTASSRRSPTSTASRWRDPSSQRPRARSQVGAVHARLPRCVCSPLRAPSPPVAAPAPAAPVEDDLANRLAALRK